jgi:hypothetical protein
MKKILLGAVLGGVVAAAILIVSGVIFFRTRLPQFNQNGNPAAWMSRWAGSGGMMDRWDSDNIGPGMMNRRNDNNNYAPGMMNPRFDRGGYGPGMMGRGFDDDDFGPGMMGGRFAGDVGPRGWMHDDMVSAVAEKLGLSTEDLQGRLDKGETIYEVATAEGLSEEEFQATMEEAHTAAIDKALADGEITQEQADWMKERSDDMGTFRRGGFAGGCPYLEDTDTTATPVPGS